MGRLGDRSSKCDRMYEGHWSALHRDCLFNQVFEGDDDNNDRQVHATDVACDEDPICDRDDLPDSRAGTWA